jgi:hypothetical protein
MACSLNPVNLKCTCSELFAEGFDMPQLIANATRNHVLDDGEWPVDVETLAEADEHGDLSHPKQVAFPPTCCN